MAKKKKRNTLFNAALALQRKIAVQQGFYDGRFKPKKIANKKKEANKRKSRRKVDPNEVD